MIRNYIKIALRNIMRHKFFSFINIFGLAAGMSICLLIIAMLIEQKSYDQFHVNKGRIYRIITHAGGGVETATSPALLAEELEKYAGVAQTARVKRGFGGDATFQQTTVPVIGFFADATLLEVFDFPLKYGNAQLALQEPFSIVLSQEIAEKLFGEENPVGKTLSFEERGLDAMGYSLGAQKGQPYGDFKVTGVFKETKQKSHIPLKAFISYATREALVKQGIWEESQEKWSSVYDTYTYVLLRDGYSAEALDASISQIAQREFGKLEEQYHSYYFLPQPLAEITPGRLINNPLVMLMPLEAYYFLGALALLVMLTAGFNYTNLSIARSLTRAKEVGVRKVSGAVRSHLFGQFVGESIIIALLSLSVGIMLFQVLRVGFVNLWINDYLHFELHESISVYAYFVLFSVLVGMIAGIYPALYMSRYAPLQVLKQLKLVRPGGFGTRKVLITVQFTLSLVFVLTALIAYRQLDRYLQMEYGFTKENMLNVELQGQDFDMAANRLSAVNTVEDISGCWFVPSTGVSIGKQVRLQEEDETLNLHYMSVTPNYFDNHQIPVVAGRPFTAEGATSEVVINEKAIQLLGYDDAQQAIGTSVIVDEMNDSLKNVSAVIVGVIGDFQDGLPMEERHAMILNYDPGKIKIANVRIHPTDIQQTLASLEKGWQEVDPLHAFEAKFLDDQLNTSMKAFGDVLKIFGFLTLLAVSIACLGLLGMAVFTAESRIKEIGIRKVLGAEWNQLVFLLSKGFLGLLLLSVLFAVPIAYFGNQLWLQNFANHIALGPGIFLSGIAVMLALGLIVIVSQTLRAALINPVETLKDE